MRILWGRGNEKSQDYLILVKTAEPEFEEVARSFKPKPSAIRISVTGMSGSIYNIVWIGFVQVQACVDVRVKVKHAVYLPEHQVVIFGFVVAAESHFYGSSTWNNR